MRLALALLITTVAACVPAWKKSPHDEIYQRAPVELLHRQPITSGIPTDWWNTALHTTVVPFAKLLSPARWIDAATESRPALDVNAFGEVADSTWFTNRMGRYVLTPEAVAKGPNTGFGPAPGSLLVISGKTEGATPGTVVRDSQGVVWFVKFDPPGFPQLTTGAEMTASRLVWAAGYWVPETYLLELDLSRLRLASNATTVDDYNRTIPLTQEALGVLILQLNANSEGRVHALFSRQVPGRAVGPFRYRGVRADDPNDNIPHERRRSLRGLRLFSAWLNNTDTRSQNTIDAFIEVDAERNLGYVRHYLIDFGDSLGAVGDREKHAGEGYEYRIDWSQVFKRMFGLGLRYPYWLGAQRSPYRSVGIFESEYFDPQRWRPIMPNPAFDEVTAEDEFWAASIMAHFQREHVEAAVSTAAYQREEAAALVTDVLMARRNKVLRYVFERMVGFDEPRVDNGYEVRFEDLEVMAGLRTLEQRYGWQLRWNRTAAADVIVATGIAAEPRIELRAAVRKLMSEHGQAFADDPYLTLRLRRLTPDATSPRVEVHLRAVRDYLLPVGLWREVR